MFFIINYYAGANTPQGFISYFENVYNHSDYDKVYLLKGGSGVGKSTALKKIANFFHNKGFDVEKVLCGSDPTSLDGVNIPQLKIAFFDATAPHAMEATVPVILEEIIDLAQFLDRDSLLINKEAVLNINSQKKQCYNHCYNYLKILKSLMDLNNNIYIDHLNKTVIEYSADKLANDLLTEKAGGDVSSRRLLSESFSYMGESSLTADLVKSMKVYTTKLDNLFVHGLFMKSLLKAITKLGYSTEIFTSVYDGTVIKTITVPEKNLAFTCERIKGARTISSKNWLKDSLTNHDLILSVHNVMITKLTDLAKNKLIEAFTHHEKLEAIYSSAMDFVGVDRLIDKLLSQYKEVLPQ